MISKEIKKSLEEAKKTNQLYISHEIITPELWSEIFKLTNLQELDFSANQITEIPKEIRELTNLQTLYFWENQITEIPKEIGELSNLIELLLWGNQIKKVPKEIGKLSNLQGLHFDGNQITEIPKEIGKLSNLQGLYLAKNQLKKLPKEIEELTNLQVFDFSENPVSIPLNFEFINFKLFENLKLENLSDKINLIIGKNGTGKTSILQAITFALVNEDNKEINIKLEKYIGKKLKKKENLPLNSSFLNQNKDKQKNEAIVKTIYSENIIKKIAISNRINELDFKIKNNNLLLSYGSNLFHEKDIFNYKIIENLVNGNAESYSIFSIFNDFTDKFIDPTQTLRQLKAKTKTNKDVTEVHNILLKTLNNFLELQEIEKFQIVEATDEYFYSNEKGQNFLLSELSEGYRSNILLVSNILVHILSARKKFSNKVSNIFSKVTGTVLIDEFDKHLHPTWQYVFISKLREILPNIQFFLSTQNPLSVQAGVGGKVIILDNKEVIIKELESNSIEVILNEYFDFNSNFFDKKTEELFANFYDRIKFLSENKMNLKTDKDFKKIITKLSKRGEEVVDIVFGELRRLEIKNNKDKK